MNTIDGVTLFLFSTAYFKLAVISLLSSFLPTESNQFAMKYRSKGWLVCASQLNLRRTIPFVKVFLFTTFVLLARPMTSTAQETEEGETLSSGHLASPAALAERTIRHYQAGTLTQFESVYPFADGRDLVEWAIDNSVERRAGFARLVDVHDNRAVIILAGVILFGNSGEETSATKGFSEVYEAQFTEKKGWHLTRQIPLDTLGLIQHQSLDVALQPGIGLAVTDTLTIQLSTPYGWAARLNHGAKINQVTVNGAPVEYDFGGGLLWVDAPKGVSTVLLSYDMDVARDSTTDTNSGRFETTYGHLRNQYFWHPFVWFDRGSTHFSITVQAPSDTFVATDLVQTESMVGDHRIVAASTQEPTFALSLFYDKEWAPVVQQAGPFELHIFATPGFEPTPDMLKEHFLATYNVLRPRFGAPPHGSISIVQSRARLGSGWNYRTNNALATPHDGGSRIIRDEPYPRAWFGHEVAHGWTFPTGPAANFLREGWATYAESLLLKSRYGARVEQHFWEMERNIYETRGFNGQAIILNDPHNSGVAYYKGAWIFRMLEAMLGEDAFNLGLQHYMQIPPGEEAGIDQFIVSLSEAAGFDVSSMVRPWVEQSTIPDITTRIEGHRVVFTQRGSVFELPLEIELETPSGTVRRTIEMESRVDTVDIGDLAGVTSVRIDPDHHFLLTRHWGEHIRLEMPAGNEDSVLLNADFLPEPKAAVRKGDTWLIEIPVSEGRYYWNWMVDGEAESSHLLLVRPLVKIKK